MKLTKTANSQSRSVRISYNGIVGHTRQGRDRERKKTEREEERERKKDRGRERGNIFNMFKEIKIQV